MKRSAVLLSLSLAVPGAWAQTVAVPSDFATVGAAVASVLANPAAPDVINVSPGTYLETSGVAVVADSVEDTNITIQGTDPANRPILVLSPLAGQPSTTLNGRGMVLSVTDYAGAGNENDVTFTLNNVVLLPAVGGAPNRAFYSNNNSAGLSANAVMNINARNVLISANNGSNAPVSTTGLTQGSLAGGQAFTDDGFYVQGVTGTVNVDHLVSTHLAGANPDGLVFFPDNVATINIGPGCVFSYTDRIGIQIAQDGATVNINGTKSEPVIITGTGSAWGGGNQLNGGLAMFHDNAFGTDPPSGAYTASHLYIIGNNHSGIDVAFVDAGQSTPPATFTNCIVANNGVTANPTGILIGDDHRVAWTFDRCTIVDNFGSIVDYGLAGGVDSSSSVTFTNSILGGRSGATAGNLDDEQIELNDAACTLNLTNSALVLSGAFAAAGTGVLNTGGGTVNQVGVVNADPDFVSAQYDYSSDVLDVRNTADYAGAGVGGSDLAGAAELVHTLGQTTLTITLDGDPSDWTGAAGPVGSLTFDPATQQLIYNDPAGDDLGDGDYTAPTNGAFNDTESDIEEVRFAQDGDYLYVLVRTGAYGTGFGADFETAMTSVTLNHDDVNGSNANDFGAFSDTRLSNALGWEVQWALGETGSGIYSAINGVFAANANAVSGEQSEANAAVEFRVDLAALGVFLDGPEINATVGQGHSSGGAYRNVQAGAAGAFDGGGGNASPLNNLISRVYDLASPGISQADQEAQIANAVIGGSEIPFFMDLPTTPVRHFELYR
ncbi:MAG: hypothetical protein HUU25_03025 [Candidatus Sumerlaeia bacterium]|nr:hypothetical protein [Candidatus Sumerlaeia bacterium]